MMRKRKLKPEKARRKDARTLDSLIRDLQSIVGPARIKVIPNETELQGTTAWAAGDQKLDGWEAVTPWRFVTRPHPRKPPLVSSRAAHD